MLPLLSCLLLSLLLQLSHEQRLLSRLLLGGIRPVIDGRRLTYARGERNAAKDLGQLVKRNESLVAGAPEHKCRWEVAAGEPLQHVVVLEGALDVLLGIQVDPLDVPRGGIPSRMALPRGNLIL